MQALRCQQNDRESNSNMQNKMYSTSAYWNCCLLISIRYTHVLNGNKERQTLAAVQLWGDFLHLQAADGDKFVLRLLYDQVAQLLHLAAAPVASHDEVDEILTLHGNAWFGVLVEEHVPHDIPRQLSLLLCKQKEAHGPLTNSGY